MVHIHIIFVFNFYLFLKDNFYIFIIFCIFLRELDLGYYLMKKEIKKITIQLDP